MLEFIQRCTFHMQAAIQNFPSDLLKKVGSSKALVCSLSRFGGLVQGNVDSPLSRFLKGGANAAKNIYSFGFGKFYLAGSGHLGYLASLPIIGEKEVVQADDEPTFSYHVGPYMIMTNLMWGGSRVTVKELSFEPHQNCCKLRLADLLIAEQEHTSFMKGVQNSQYCTWRQFCMCYFKLMTLCVFYTPVDLSTVRLPPMLFKLFPGEAKLCNLEYMIESKDGGEHSDLTRIPVPVQLYKWCSPEVILEKVVTVKSDVYSFCTVMQEALTETPPWKGVEDSVIKQLLISGKSLEADVRLPMPYYSIVKSGLEPKQKNRSMKLQDIQYILKNDLKDLTKSQTGHADEMSKATRPAVFADVNNICLASAFSYQKRTQELQGKEITEADLSAAPRYSNFSEENCALVDQEASTSLQPVGQDKNHDVTSELQVTVSVSDVDDSLCSFEINEIFASYPELHEDFLEEGARLDQTLKDEKRQQKEGDKATLRDLYASLGVHCEEKPVYEEGGFSESSVAYTTEEEERISEVSDLCMLAQVRGDAGRRRSSLSQNEQHISKCVLNLKIVQSMIQQAADSLCRTEEKLDKLEATEKQKKLLQEIRMNQLPKQIFQEGPWNRPDDTSQNTNDPFSGVNTFLWKAIGPPSSDYIPPLTTCQAQGVLGGDSFQAVSKAAKEMEAIQNEKWKCFHEMSKSKNENNHRDLSFSVVKSLDDQMSLDHESLMHLIAISYRCYPKSRSEIYNTKISEERTVQSEWRTEVTQMARRVASGQLELGCPYPASECTSESEAESIKEAFQHVTVRLQKSQDQQRYRWQTGDNVEPWDLGSEDRSESEESDLESAFGNSGGRSCQSPSQDEQAESGIAIHKNSVLLQQVENLSRTSNAEGKLEDACEGFLQKQLPEDAGSGIQVSALSQASNHFIDELPPPAQELLDEIVPDPIKMEDRESKKESERNEKRNHSLWTKESFNLAEETESAFVI
ncbi:inactive serine/threonine-protein kinase TEX14 [Grus japonensis]|uniref:Inactive serine/threonine-protein kinase TEX14 n=1 Tax=Grus japonensis TaxID=30415 RepID=A0ABC9XLC0_GRUJA